MVLSNAIETARNSIREGHSDRRPAQEERPLSAAAVHMIAVGEKSGELEQMLGKAADAYDERGRGAVAALTHSCSSR